MVGISSQGRYASRNSFGSVSLLVDRDTGDRSAAGQSPRPDDRSEVAAWHLHSRRMSAYADGRRGRRATKYPNATKLPIWGRTSTTLFTCIRRIWGKRPQGRRYQSVGAVSRRVRARLCMGWNGRYFLAGSIRISEFLWIGFAAVARHEGSAAGRSL